MGGSSYTLSYDAENRLVGVSGAATATFVYDGDGNRVKGTVGSATTAYVGNYFEWTGSTTTMKKYYYAGSVKVAMRTGSTTINYLLGDHLGSNAITTSSSGVKNSEIRYMPWGTTRYTSGSSPTTFQYTGQRLETNLGLLFYNARWYDPAAARFIQPDTLIPEQSQGVQAWDRYAYTNNNPVKYTDPTGHRNCEEDGYGCSVDIASNTTLTVSTTTLGSATSEQQGSAYYELSNAQKVGKVITTIFIEVAVVAPVEITLVSLSLAAPEIGGVGAALEFALIPADIAVADFGLSLAINTADSVSSGHDIDFKWTLIPAIVNELPQPVQNFFYDVIPSVIPKDN